MYQHRHRSCRHCHHHYHHHPVSPHWPSPMLQSDSSILHHPHPLQPLAKETITFNFCYNIITLSYLHFDIKETILLFYLVTNHLQRCVQLGHAFTSVLSGSCYYIQWWSYQVYLFEEMKYKLCDNIFIYFNGKVCC